MSEQDPILQLREKAKKNAAKALDLVQATVGQDVSAVLEKKPELKPEAVAATAEAKGVPYDRAIEIANEVVTGQPPAVRVEAYRAENELREVFLQLYSEEISRMKFCPVKVKQPGGSWSTCGASIDTIQQALVHHSMHLLYSSDYRTQRQIMNDISEKLFPTEIRGVSAVLGPEERAGMLRDPRLRDRLLGRSQDD